MVDDNGYKYDAEFPERALVGKVVRVERIGPRPYGRVSYEIDCIDGNVSPSEVSGVLSETESFRSFAVLRVLTTPRRLVDLFGVEFREGDWLRLDVRPADGIHRPIVFHSQLRPNGYTEQSRGSLFEASFLFSDKDAGPPPRSLGAAASSAIATARSVASAVSFPAAAMGDQKQVADLLSKVSGVHCVNVRDVGQASFVSLLDEDGIPIVHFDVGWPISFNGKTAPVGKNIPGDSAPIILSHWDYDHLLGCYQFPFLCDNIWLAPVQSLGPGQARIASQLSDRKRLIGWSGGTVSVGGVTLLKCSGAHDLNDTGFSLKVSLESGGRALLVGDASYNAVPLVVSDRFEILVVTHHGARFTGTVPTAARIGACGVISVGEGNVYRHPRFDAVREHLLAGWCVCATAGIYGAPRGDRLLAL